LEPLAPRKPTANPMTKAKPPQQESVSLAIS
jgi:hypothetical protein